MTFHKLFIGAFAALAVFAACQEKPEDLGEPRIDLDQTEIHLAKEASEQTLTFVSTRAWSIKDLPGWLAAQPAKGEASLSRQTVVLSALANTGNDRSAVLTLSCGIVKEYITVNQKGEQGQTVKNDGSREHPFSATEANEYVRANVDAGASTSQAFYVHGFVKNFASKHSDGIKGFGNALFYITDDKEYTSEDFYCFQVYYLGGKKFTSEDQIKIGDEVVVYGQLTNYNGTPETVGKGAAYIYSLNGETEGGDEPGPGPGPVDPITGTNLLDNGSFEDWTAEKPEGWNFEKGNASLTKSSDAKDGSNACEVGGDPTAQENRRLMSKPYSLKAGTYQIQAYIKGEGQYRVGYTKLTNGAVAGSSDYIYVDSEPVQAAQDWELHTVEFTLSSQTDVCITVMNSKKGAGKSVLIDDIKLLTENGGLVSGGGGGSGDNPVDYENAPAKTVAEFLAAKDGSTYYKLSGTVSDFGAAYCSFDLTDATGTVFVYSVKNKDDWSSKIHEGGTVVLAGKYSFYEKDSKDEVVDAYILSYDASTEVETEGPKHPLTSSISWTLGNKAYDNTSNGDSKQTATINGVEVDNLLKLGTASVAGDAKFTIPAGVDKIGFYAIGWVSADLSVGAETVSFNKNSGCSGNAPYTITLKEDDYYEVSVQEGQVTVTCPSRVLIIGVNPVK